MSWWQRRGPDLGGSVLFRGGIPSPESFEGLLRHGFEISRTAERPDLHWGLEVRHSRWGTARILCLRDMPLPPPAVVEASAGLLKEDRTLIRSAGSLVSVTVTPEGDHVLRERKRLLRFLHAAMGDDGLAAMDHTSLLFWTRQALEDELAHDADADISAIFTMHAVTEDKGGKAHWVHTHGLRELGHADYDILEPSQDLVQRGFDLFRALAFKIVEGEARMDGEPVVLAGSDGAIRLVGVQKVLASGCGTAEWRGQLDQEHTDGHAVVCEPSGGWRSLFGDKPRLSRLLSGPVPDDKPLNFSTPATGLMAERARNTYGVLKALSLEFAGLGLPVAVKLGYETDKGSPITHEHLWFEVHACAGDRIDATLANRPIFISGMKEGTRAQHDPGLLSDWMMFTPFGNLSPCSLRALRELRARRGELPPPA